MAAVKYFDLKQNRISNYEFSYDKMLDTKGNTAVYLLYSYARLCSIIRKSGYSESQLDELIHTKGF
jgi:arginyl-tRNA synthetase